MSWFTISDRDQFVPHKIEYSKPEGTFCEGSSVYFEKDNQVASAIVIGVNGLKVELSTGDTREERDLSSGMLQAVNEIFSKQQDRISYLETLTERL